MTIMESIKQAHDQITGWCSWQKAETLASIVLATRPKVCVEIGVWGGRSFIPVAMALKHVGAGKAIAIDPWKAEESIQGQVHPEDVKWWGNQLAHETVYALFIEKVQSLGLQSHVEILRSPSSKVVPASDVGLLSIDGNHGEQAIRDVKQFAPGVAKGGLLMMDDIDWSGGAVNAAVRLLPELGFIELYTVNDAQSGNRWAVFQRL